tara:strand:- start:169 stop:555 length:387 start_codon:yes stop_codon:yes gene_type:complete
MARLNKLQLRQLIKDRYHTQKNFCDAFGVSLPGLNKWLNGDEIREKTLEKIAVFFQIEPRVLNLSDNDIDKDRYMEIIKKLKQISSDTGVTPDVEEIASWAVFIYTNQNATTTIDTSAFEQSLSFKNN